MDKMTQKSKGYGFVTFKSMDGAHAALENPEKMIDVRNWSRPVVDASTCLSRPVSLPHSRVLLLDPVSFRRAIHGGIIGLDAKPLCILDSSTAVA